jgi:3-(3-hydroxy-phenyl)propionate hydroxylase
LSPKAVRAIGSTLLAPQASPQVQRQESFIMVDVAIVGFGPTGAVAAGLLGLEGLTVYACDASSEVYPKPRAIALDHEIMRIFQQLGLEREIEPHTEPFTDSEFYGVNGQLIKCMSSLPAPYPLTFVPSLVFSQPPVEAIIRKRVQQLAPVTVDLGQTCVGVVQGAQSVVLHVQDPQGQVKTVEAKYLIACDGASSTVRKMQGLDLLDLGFEQSWLVVDVLLNERGLKKTPRVSVQYCEPQRPSSYIMGAKNHRRWEISINAGEDPEQVASVEGTWALLKRWITPDDAQLWRQASYRFHALVAKSWRQGRVFLAGDAAHQQPPFLGQGMCQGLRDAQNLSWKLVQVLKGSAQACLLDTYGQERKAHVTALTERIKHIGELVGERDTSRAMARDAQLLAQCNGLVQPTPRQNVQPALSEGCLGQAASWVPNLAQVTIGTVFPQAWVLDPQTQERVRMDTVTGCGWRLFLSETADAQWDKVVLNGALNVQVFRWDAKGLQECDGVVKAWFVNHGVQAALVRPDHIVFGVYGAASEVHGLKGNHGIEGIEGDGQTLERFFITPTHRPEA